ncbi:hypothetical protein Tco_1403546 [Tanacetum coccineum]
MALAEEERVSVGKESARNVEWIKISLKKVHTLLEMEDNDDRKSFLDYMCIDLNYVEEQTNNLMSKHRNLVQELNTCKEHLLVLKQAKLDILTMQHVNTEIFKENQNLRNELKELTSITEAWLNNIIKPKDLVFVKSSADKSKVSITGSYKPKLSETKDSALSNHETSKDFQDSPDDEEDTRSMSSDDNDVTKVKALIALTNEERVFVGKESARNGDWIKISMKKVHTLLEMEDNDDRKSFLDYLCIDLNYIEEHINNLMSKHRNLIQELNTCKEQFSVLKQAKLDLLTMQHVNTEILKENQNLRNELKELTSITEAWLNNSNKVNQCTSKQIPTQKKKILGIDQLTKDTSSSRPKYLVFVKSSTNNSKVPSNESQRNTTDHSVVVSDSSVTDYDSADESSEREALKLESGILSKQDVPGPEGMYGNNSTYTIEGCGYGHSTKRHFINKERYVKDLLRKYDKIGSSVNTQIVPFNMLGPDLNGKVVNESQYRGLDLKGYPDSDCAGCNMDKKSTSDACQLLEGKLVC